MYQLELGFASRRHTDGLDALLACFVVEEPKESLMRFYTISGVFFDNLECEFQNITLGKC
jgi:hypothetical protein